MARNRPETLEEDKNRKMNTETFREAMKIFEFVKPYRLSLVVGMILLFVSSMVFMLFPYLIGKMMDIASGVDFYGMDLNDIFWLMFVVLVAQGVVSYFRVLLFARLSEKGIADLRIALYEKLVSLPIVFYEENRVGELMSRLTADVERLYNAFSITIAEFLRQILLLVAGLLFLGVQTPELAFIMLLTFPVAVVLGMFFGRWIRTLSKERQQTLADTNIILSETMQSISVVKAFSNELFEAIRYGKSNDTMVKIALKFANGRAIFATFIVSILFGALIFVIYEGAVLIQEGTMTSGGLVMFTFVTAIIGGSIAGLGNFYTELLGAVGATERIREILSMKSEVNPRDPSIDKEFKRFEGNIEYSNVNFHYPTREDIEVMKGINFQIKAGQKVALVGPSGSGKSTIVQLLLRFYNIQDGDIKVDDKSIFDYNISAFRRNFAIVPQEVILFGGTIRENIAYGNPSASNEEIIKAAQKSNSWEFIQTFPEALDTVVGERGIKLSGGQRQRIAIARAILKNPSILLLDEATSALDAESEKVVQDALNNLMEGRTSIIIAHRLATIRDVDCIFVIDNGRIIEQGTHEELSSIENGAYAGLAKLQFENV
ncbi:ABC transporter transmembrane domain-containing protein [Saprospiraceae bacterium]|nr:ABC transporter transmembrane domain-containing protein [bacterium]MDB4539360.1 ABC transporter transmembrane domain-containing protein [Saprospiraceae bacterium]MDC3210537.1 ABC transporter transmembrane domain-containing protein [Saprospiraceae bacterium]MDG1434221.1 ABC transporter transmembrane domain-containing protein [Saprospiraceae bacterium]